MPADADYGALIAVLEEVAEERRRQIVKWGGRGGDGIENPNQPNGIRLRVLVEEVGEVAEAMGRPEDGNGKGDLRTELIQVAAVAVAWVEALSPNGSYETGP
jgi:hypothetical protein